MGNGMKFQQRCEFRRENIFEYSSEKSKSSSSSEPAHKKHKLVSSLISLENEEAINDCSLQQNGELSPHAENPNKFSEGRKVYIRKMDTLSVKDLKRDSNKRVSRKKDKPCVFEGAALDDLKIFMNSLLEDLKVTSEDLFTWMKEEMQKLESDNTDMQPEMREGSDIGKSNRVYDHENLEVDMQVDHQNDFEENIQEHHQNSSEENLLIQNRNGFKDDCFWQHQNSFNDSLCMQDPEKPEESSKAEHQNNFEENMQMQHQNNFELSMIAGSLERDIKSDKETAEFEDPTEKYRGEKLVLPVKPNNQSSAVNYNVLMQDQKNSASGWVSKYYNGGSLENFRKGKRTTDSNCYQVLKHRDQEIESTRKEPKERLGLSVESNLTSHSSSHIASSMYLSLPTVLSDPQYMNQGRDTFSSSYTEPKVAENRIRMNSGGGNLMPDSSTHHGHFSGMQLEDRNRIFSPIYSGNVGFIDQKSTLTSTIGAGFPIPLHEGTECGFSIPGHISFENPTQEKKNSLGLIMDRGAIRYSGGSYASSEHYNTKKFSSLSNNKADDRLRSFPNLRP
ncbi:hypothetical protein FNV43_RR09290 [Rhamnella rubrinervis]|uniref:Uncharacterized protein n=1 Tax=Rhamnella rubrinervis TaxID=2594499 RepID=A0A8K0H9Q1_9ROSA|nr:hypothetical protein FNV43_RR09290 [Rhamnella rubrinervis]